MKVVESARLSFLDQPFTKQRRETSCDVLSGSPRRKIRKLGQIRSFVQSGKADNPSRSRVQGNNEFRFFLYSGCQVLKSQHAGFDG